MLVAAAVAGCGDDDEPDSPDTVDGAQIEQEIEQSLSTATTEVTSVSCPDDVESETGAKFTCNAKLKGGGSAKVKVTQEGPNEFTYAFKPGTVQLAGSTVDKELEQDLAANGIPDATVNCPDPVKVKAGTTVTCPVAGARGAAATISFQFTDDSGSIDESSVETGPLEKEEPMAIYKMREKMLSIGDDFWIENDAGERVFKVDGKKLRVRQTLKFEDRDGHELLKIQERKLSVRDKMAIERDGDKVATVRKKLITPLRERFKVELATGGEYDVKGNIVDHEYTFERDGREVASVSKRWFRVRDSYGVEVAGSENDMLVLAVTVAIDQMTHDKGG